jgi:hypothetical protein
MNDKVNSLHPIVVVDPKIDDINANSVIQPTEDVMTIGSEVLGIVPISDKGDSKWLVGAIPNPSWWTISPPSQLCVVRLVESSASNSVNEPTGNTSDVIENINEKTTLSGATTGSFQFGGLSWAHHNRRLVYIYNIYVDVSLKPHLVSHKILYPLKRSFAYHLIECFDGRTDQSRQWAVH